MAPPSFVCALSHEALIREQCRSIDIEPLLIILEPCARNTAPVAAAIALEIDKIDPEGLILLLPADHHIEQPRDFWTAVEKGMMAATSGSILTFGILPTHAETGYGYIQSGDEIGDQCVKVKAFVEKPDKETAEIYVKSGDYFWNGGIFLFSPETMITAFSKHAPDISGGVKETIEASKRSGTSLYLDPLSFANCRSESIDYAIMESASNIAMVCPVSVGWTDIGSWEAILNYMSNDAGDVATHGPVYSLDCSNAYISSAGTFVAAIGLKNDIVIVATEKSILVTDSRQTQSVKKVVQHLKKNESTDLL